MHFQVLRGGGPVFGFQLLEVSARSMPSRFSICLGQGTVPLSVRARGLAYHLSGSWDALLRLFGNALANFLLSPTRGKRREANGKMWGYRREARLVAGQITALKAEMGTVPGVAVMLPTELELGCL